MKVSIGEIEAGKYENPEEAGGWRYWISAPQDEGYSVPAWVIWTRKYGNMTVVGTRDDEKDELNLRLLPKLFEEKQ